MTGQFDWFRDNHVENMERMFAAVSDLYAEYWHDFFHFAIFEDEAESWDSAFERTHRRYLEALRIRDGSKVVELACGRGGFADFVAANSAGEVLGIDVSRSQLSHARRRKRPGGQSVGQTHPKGELGMGGTAMGGAATGAPRRAHRTSRRLESPS